MEQQSDKGLSKQQLKRQRQKAAKLQENNEQKAAKLQENNELAALEKQGLDDISKKQEELGNHEFGDNNGCHASTRCDWGPCNCNLDQCHWCGICRGHGTKAFLNNEKCRKNTKYARDAKAAREKRYHPEIPAVKGTHLKMESMVPYSAYEVVDYLSVPDCQCGSHEKDHGPVKITSGRVMKDDDDLMLCNKCLHF